MFVFDFHFQNGKNMLYEGITSATVYSVTGVKTITGEAIKEYDFVNCVKISLKSENANYSVSCDGLRSLEVTKEQQGA